MVRLVSALVLCLCLGSWALAQQDQTPNSDQSSEQGREAQAERDNEAGISSSRDTKIDISPPADDAKSHPNSGAAVVDAEEEAAEGAADQDGDVQEMHPFDPHRAAKDLEVGDFYFKQKNYRAALSRYREALFYKSGDAVANFRMGECLEKMGRPTEAVVHYEAYLKILPEGPFSKDAHKALEKLNAEEKATAPEKESARP
jgi:tetratricopeptide (TPR) repeat protein